MRTVVRETTFYWSDYLAQISSHIVSRETPAPLSPLDTSHVIITRRLHSFVTRGRSCCSDLHLLLLLLFGLKALTSPFFAAVIDGHMAKVRGGWGCRVGGAAVPARSFLLPGRLFVPTMNGKWRSGSVRARARSRASGRVAF